MEAVGGPRKKIPGAHLSSWLPLLLLLLLLIIIFPCTSAHNMCHLISTTTLPTADETFMSPDRMLTFNKQNLLDIQYKLPPAAE